MTSLIKSSSTGTRLAALAGSLALIAGLAGCGMTGSNTSAITTGGGTNAGQTGMKGVVHGGQQPISGATISLYAAGITGYGAVNSTTPVATTTTNAGGGFTLPAYTCPVTVGTPPPPTQMYLVATKGNSQGGGANNTFSAMMAALGPCPSGGNLAATIPNVVLDEVTTVAAVWALQQFMAAPASTNSLIPSIGAPSTSYSSGTTTLGTVQPAINGMSNAFVTSHVLADFTTSGFTPNPAYPYATPESAKINTIADILAACINTDPTSGSLVCSQLMTAATPTVPSGQFTATDTIQAAWYMAQNPTYGETTTPTTLTTLYNLIPPTPPFQPIYVAPGTLNSTSTAPATNAFNDTTIAINYAPIVATTGNNALSDPYGIAIDAYGNAWISNDGGVNATGSTTTASATELGVDGSPLIIPIATYTASATNGSASQFTAAPSGAALTRTFAAPRGVAIDLSNRAWVSNFGDLYAAVTTTSPTSTAGSVGVFNGSTASGINGANGGLNATPIGYFVGGGPSGIAVDGANNVFVVNSSSISSTTPVLDGASLAQLVSAVGTANDGTYTYSTSGSVLAPYRTPGGGTENVAIDTNTNVATGGIVWVSDSNGCKITGQFNAATYFGTVNQYADSTLAPLADSDAISSSSGATVGVGSSTNCGSTSTFVGQVYTAPTANFFGIAIDRNNGVWLSDVYTSSTGFDGLTYLVAPSTTAGLLSGAYSLANGTLPTQTSGGSNGTTLVKTGALAVDGNNNVWIGNQSGKSIAEAKLSGTTITLLTPGQGGAFGTTGAAGGIGFSHSTSANTGLAIDSSGNVWAANNTTSTSTTYTNSSGVATNYGNSVTVVVGAAAPVITPLSLAIKANKLGTKP